MMRSLLPLGVDIAGLALDTAVAAYLLDPSTDHYRLGDLASASWAWWWTTALAARARAPSSSRTSDPTDGDGTDAGMSDDARRAVGRLASVLARLRPPLTEALAAVGEVALYEDIEQPLVRVLARMEVVGIPVDRDVLRSIAAGLADECQLPGGHHPGAWPASPSR